MSKERAPKIQYTVVNEDALAEKFPEMFTMVRTLDKAQLYKKVKAAKELGADIPGVKIGDVVSVSLESAKTLLEAVSELNELPMQDLKPVDENPLADVPALFTSKEAAQPL